MNRLGLPPDRGWRGRTASPFILEVFLSGITFEPPSPTWDFHARYLDHRAATRAEPSATGRHTPGRCDGSGPHTASSATRRHALGLARRDGPYVAPPVPAGR